MSIWPDFGLILFVYSLIMEKNSYQQRQNKELTIQPQQIGYYLVYGVRVDNSNTKEFCIDIFIKFLRP